jgi:hypothetical protein
MFLAPFSGKYFPRDGETLDPQKLNSNFRDAAQKIRYVQSLKYTYSVMQFDLTNIDFSKGSEERRYIIRPASDCEIVGSHLSLSGLATDQLVSAKWLSPSDLKTAGTVPLSGQIALISGTSAGAAGTAPPNPSNVSLPEGGETVTWKYIEVEGRDGFTISEDITQRSLRLTRDQNYVIEIGSPNYSGTGLVSSEASLTVWMRTNRGTFEGWKMIELLDGSDIPYVTPPVVGDPRGIGDIVDDLNAQALLATQDSTRNTYKCDVISVRGTALNPININGSVNDLKREFGRRIPRTQTILDNGSYSGDIDENRTNTAWSLHRVDFALVSAAATFSVAGFNAAMQIRSDGNYAPPVGSVDFYKISDPKIEDYKEILVQGEIADGSVNGRQKQINSDTIFAGNPVSPLDHRHDLFFNPLITDATETVSVAYMYIWYKLTI